jgi:hypothetical protein
MRVNDFLHLVVQDTRPQLPTKLREFQTSTRFTLIQVYYSRRTLHYEVWVRGKERLIEIGLHFESDKTTNAAMLDYFSARAFEIKDAIGDSVEIEQWTSSWTRIHQLMPYQHLDSTTAESVSQRLAKMIETLQPMLERAAVRMNRAPRVDPR